MHVFVSIIIMCSYSAFGLNDWWEPVGLAEISDDTTEESSFTNMVIYHTKPCCGPLALADIIDDFGAGERFKKIEWHVENNIYLILTDVRMKNNTIRRATVQYGNIELCGRVYQAGEKILLRDKFYDKENCFF